MPGRWTGGSSRTTGVEKACAAAAIGGRGVTTMVMALAAAPAATVRAIGLDGLRVDDGDGGVHGTHTPAM
jgi:hypothetical protein